MCFLSWVQWVYQLISTHDTNRYSTIVRVQVCNRVTFWTWWQFAHNQSRLCANILRMMDHRNNDEVQWYNDCTRVTHRTCIFGEVFCDIIWILFSHIPDHNHYRSSQIKSICRPDDHHRWSSYISSTSSQLQIFSTFLEYLQKSLPSFLWYSTPTEDSFHPWHLVQYRGTVHPISSSSACSSHVFPSWL